MGIQSVGIHHHTVYPDYDVHAEQTLVAEVTMDKQELIAELGDDLVDDLVAMEDNIRDAQKTLTEIRDDISFWTARVYDIVQTLTAEE